MVHAVMHDHQCSAFSAQLSNPFRVERLLSGFELLVAHALKQLRAHVGARMLQQRMHFSLRRHLRGVAHDCAVEQAERLQTNH